MKRVIVILWTAVMSANVWSASEVVDGVTWNYSVSNGKASVYKESWSSAIPAATRGALTIPATLGGCPVTSIGSYAFYNCSGLTSVTIPEGVTSIGDCAFRECSVLTSVTIPSSVTSIGDCAFYYCSGLMSVTIPEGVTSIGSSAFYECSGLTSVTIPSNVTSIGSSAFYWCSGLTSVTIPESVTSIGSSAFYECSGLTSVAIPGSVKSVGASAFYGCSALTSVNISEGVESIHGACFASCSKLEYIEFPASLSVMATQGSASVQAGGRWYRDYFDMASLKCVKFKGKVPPTGFEAAYFVYNKSAVVIEFPREFGGAWMSLINDANKFHGYNYNRPEVLVLSAAIRENDSTVMDVIYKVKSAKPTVKVRALAFQDGERSFAKVVRPTEFIEDTAKNIGDAIAANEEHKLSWRVSADWKVDLAKVKFEVLASDGDLLPLELTTIPKIGDHAAMEISWNAMTSQQVLDALLWLYADGDEHLMVSEGKAFWDGNLAVNGTTLQSNSSSYYSRTKNPDTGKYDYVYYTNATECVYSKMGFGTLSGDNLKYANEMTRLGLSPSGVRQYAWREVKE